MGGGRKNLKRAAVAGKRESLNVEDGHNIVQVVSLLGSNSIEVMDEKGAKSLALFPAKFKKLVWIKPGNFVVVDESGKEKATESGSKVTSIVSQIVSSEQIQMLQKSPDWPEVFKSKTKDDPDARSKQEVDELNQSDDEEDDDGLPPLEANMNRVQPFKSHCDDDEDSDTDSSEND